MAVRPLRPATDRRFGGPLPRQLANRTRTHPIPIKSFHTVPCDTVRLCGIISRFQLLSPCMGQVVHALLTRPPLSLGKTRSIASYFTRQRQVSVRLACVRHAASVHPEPGSNSRKYDTFRTKSICEKLAVGARSHMHAFEHMCLAKPNTEKKHRFFEVCSVCNGLSPFS